MLKTFVKHLLRTDTILVIGLFKSEQAKCFIFGKFSLKIPVKCLNHLIIGNTSNYDVIIRVIFASPTLRHEVKPRLVVCLKFQHFPIIRIKNKVVSVKISILLTTTKTLGIFHRLSAQRSEIKPFAKSR